MNDKEAKIREKVASSREATNRLLKELMRLKRIIMEDREKIIKELEKRGVLGDVFSYLQEEADKGDQVSLNVFNLWKYGRLPKQKIKT